MSITIVPKSKQGSGAFNGGEIKENKPLGFPQDGGELKPYSNLFYWAHAWAEKTSTLGIHPHQGFEIMSFVLKGEIEHYDTKHQVWKKLQAGDAQIIRSGKGISHSEKFYKGSHIFQIWMDPNLAETLNQEASYDDYAAESFPTEQYEGFSVKTYKGVGAPINMDSRGLGIKEYILESGKHKLSLNKESVYSAYLIDGEISVPEGDLAQDDFMVVKGADQLEITAERASQLFVIESPVKLDYPTYPELMKQRMQRE